MAEGARKLEGTGMIEVNAVELAQEAVLKVFGSSAESDSSYSFEAVRESILNGVAALEPEVDVVGEIELLKDEVRHLVTERYGAQYVDSLFSEIMHEAGLLLMERGSAPESADRFGDWVNSTGRQKVVEVLRHSSMPPGMDAE